MEEVDSEWLMATMGVNGWMFLLVLAHLGCPGQNLESRKTVVWVCVVSDYPGEPVPEETFTHSHLIWSSIILYQLPPSTVIYSILPVQFTCLIVFFAEPLCKSSLVYLLVWIPPIHTPYISWSNHCPLFATHAHIIATYFALVPRLSHLILVSLSTLYLEICLLP